MPFTVPIVASHQSITGTPVLTSSTAGTTVIDRSGQTVTAKEFKSYVVTVDPVLESNLSRGRMINEVNRAKDYDILPVETFPGEYKLGHDGFMEFHPDTDSILSWVLSTFYTPVE